MHVRAIKAILEEAGYDIEQVEARDPGIVIYEDSAYEILLLAVSSHPGVLR